MAETVSPNDLKQAVKHAEYLYSETLTICVITMTNGFKVLGQSACADPSMYNKELGERLSFQDAFNKMWPLLGYALKDRLYLNQTKESTWEERLALEHDELENRIERLDAYISRGAPEAQDPESRSLLHQQLASMISYKIILSQRLALLKD